MKRTLFVVVFLALLASSAMAAPSGKVMLYSSMQEDQLVAIKKGFEAKYPDIVMDYYFAGTGRVKYGSEILRITFRSRKKESSKSIHHRKRQLLPRNSLTRTAFTPAQE